MIDTTHRTNHLDGSVDSLLLNSIILIRELSLIAASGQLGRLIARLVL